MIVDYGGWLVLVVGILGAGEDGAVLQPSGDSPFDETVRRDGGVRCRWIYFDW